MVILHAGDFPYISPQSVSKGDCLGHNPIYEIWHEDGPLDLDPNYRMSCRRITVFFNIN